MDVIDHETNDAEADGEVVWSWPPDAEAKLRKMIARRREQESPVPGESTKETVKTVAQGMPDDLAEPVVTAASFSYCWRAMGEAFTRHSLRPLHFGGYATAASLGRERVAGM